MSRTETAPAAASRLYRAVWRWHFYAGLFVIPFIVFLSITGSVYLFRPQIETWLDRPYDNRTAPQTAAPSAAAMIALARNPGWRLSKYQLPRGPNSAAQVLISRDGVERRLYVDRSSLAILKSVEEQKRPMLLIFRLHGELLAGDRGSNLVELAASWAIVMLVTGMYLWWPRGTTGLGGVLYPRWGRGRTTLRDLHAVTGMWVSILALAFLLSGLPWASNWGHYFRTVRTMAGLAPITQSWFAGPGEEKRALQVEDAAAEHAAHKGMAMASMPGEPHAMSYAVPEGLDEAYATALRLHFAPPVMLMAPRPDGVMWKAVSQTLNVPRTAMATIDGRSGRVASRTDFAQQLWLDRLVGYTTATHQGQLFGWPNQLANLCLALGLITMSVTAILMWWRRRSTGTLGAPAPPGARGWSWGLFVAVLGLGALLPEFLASLVLVLMCERLVLRHIPRVRVWLALSPG
jgi:uncharacterized iron-regulated membrane protein